MMKTHTVNGEVLGRSAFEFGPDDKVIHIVRHPCDVAISCAAFYGISIEESVRRLLTPGLMIDGRPMHGYEVLGSWAEHAKSWKRAATPVHRVRYFELVEKPDETLGAILRFLTVSPDSARIAKAVEHARFERLRMEERTRGFVENPKGRCFFRVGKPGQWRTGLTEAQADALIEPHMTLLQDLGFVEFDRAWPAKP